MSMRALAAIVLALLIGCGDDEPVVDPCATCGQGGNGGGGGGGVGGAAPNGGEPLFAQSFGDLKEQQALGAAVAPNGDVIIGGELEGLVSFGGEAIMGSGVTDAFVARFGAGGVHQSSAAWGNYEDQHAGDVAVDSTGATVITGWYNGEIDFGDGPHVSAGHYDCLVAKLDATGALVWSQSFGGAYFDYGNAVAVDEDDNIYITGFFMGAVSFGGESFTAEGTTLDGFVVSLDPGGSVRWAEQYGGQQDQQGYAIAVRDGTVWVAGRFEEALSASGLAPLAAAGAEDAFVMRHAASDGAALGGTAFGDEQAQGFYAIVATADGGAVAGGGFDGAVAAGDRTLVSSGAEDGLVVALDARGQARWGLELGDAAAQRLTALAAGADGTVLALRFAGGVSIGDDDFDSAGDDDLLVAKLDGDGAVLWAKSFGGSEADTAEALALAADGTVLVAGAIGGSVELGNFTLASEGGADAFFALLAP